MPSLPARRSVLPFALFALAILSACGAQQGGTGVDVGGGNGGNGGGGNGDGTRLCTLVSTEQMGQILDARVRQATVGSENCSYTVDDAGLVDVRYEASYDPDLETARMICDNAEDVSGIGEQAIWCPNIDVLYFNEAGRSLAVQLVVSDDELPRAAREVASDIARRVADGL